MARLAVGQRGDALDLELRGMGSVRQSSIEEAGSKAGRWREVVLMETWTTKALGAARCAGIAPRPATTHRARVDGLNQRETPRLMREAAPGGEFNFFAADPDFQVAVLDDPRSYPRSTIRYRQTVVACSGPKARYAVSVFEVSGGLQHDQFFHAAPGDASIGWGMSVHDELAGPESLLPTTIPYPESQREGRGWPLVRAGLRRVRPDGARCGHCRPALGHPGRAGSRPGCGSTCSATLRSHVVAGTTPRNRLPRRPSSLGLDAPPIFEGRRDT